MVATASFGVPRSGDQGVDALLSGWHWNSLSLTYSFPGTKTVYAYTGAPDTFKPLSSPARIAANRAFDAIESFTDLNFARVTESTASRSVDIRLARTDDAPTAFAFYPELNRGGDIWFNPVDYNAPRLGDYANHTVMHEIGHSLGLKHGHEIDNFGRLPRDINSLEFSIMTYRNYIGGHTRFATYAEDSAPQSFMMYDIAALQHMYGADFTHLNGNTEYKFNPVTGEMSINGAGKGDPLGDTIFRTIWDGGGIDTFNLRGYADDMRVNLAPGQWSTFSRAQLADLGDGRFARANVFNALLFNGDTRSLIENVEAGRGDDKIVGNQAVNKLLGASGNDVLLGMAGDDLLFGGLGADRLDGATGSDFLNGSTGNDLMNGQAGNDVFNGGAGNDDMRGGDGDDTAFYAKAAAAYTVTTVNGTTTVRDIATNEADTLIGIETLQFSDGLVPI